jgi:hypothetical protein
MAKDKGKIVKRRPKAGKAKLDKKTGHLKPGASK